MVRCLFLLPLRRQQCPLCVAGWCAEAVAEDVIQVFHMMGNLHLFLVFKLLLISAVVAPDTLDLLILLTWYTTLSCLRSLDHLANATTTHLSALGQPPRPGVVQLLLLVLSYLLLASPADPYSLAMQNFEALFAVGVGVEVVVAVVVLVVGPWRGLLRC